MNKLTSCEKVRFCLIINFISLVSIISLIFIFKNDDSKYFRVGPYDDLNVISVTIDTWTKWIVVVIFLCIMGVIDVIIRELGLPVLDFNIYNPDKKVITDFSRYELNYLSNGMFMVSSIKGVFNTVISITQLDLALITVVVKELTSIITIRFLLNEKKFTSKKDLRNVNSKIMPIT